MGWKVSRTVHKMAFIDEAQIGHARPRRCRRWRVSECNNNVICEFLSTVSTNFAVVAELIGKIFLTKRCFSTNSQHFNFRSPFLAGWNSDNYSPQTVGNLDSYFHAAVLHWFISITSSQQVLPVVQSMIHSARKLTDRQIFIAKIAGVSIVLAPWKRIGRQSTLGSFHFQ